jgi:hypothetical protein
MYESIGGTALPIGRGSPQRYRDHPPERRFAVDREILKKLHASKIFIAQRSRPRGGSGLCQTSNNKKDIDALLDALPEIINEIGRAPDYMKN